VKRQPPVRALVTSIRAACTWVWWNQQGGTSVATSVSVDLAERRRRGARQVAEVLVPRDDGAVDLAVAREPVQERPADRLDRLEVASDVRVPKHTSTLSGGRTAAPVPASPWSSVSRGRSRSAPGRGLADGAVIVRCGYALHGAQCGLEQESVLGGQEAREVESVQRGRQLHVLALDGVGLAAVVSGGLGCCGPALDDRRNRSTESIRAWSSRNASLHGWAGSTSTARRALLVATTVAMICACSSVTGGRGVASSSARSSIERTSPEASALTLWEHR